MRQCCEVMRGEMRATDEVVDEPPSGQGASLTIRYRLPRQ
jgi:5-methylcytosine-specific restriction protein A